MKTPRPHAVRPQGRMSKDPVVSEKIHRHLEKVLPAALGSRAARVEPLAGDASARRYYRVTLEKPAGGEPTAVLMEFPAAATPLGSEEATEGECPITELPFLNVARHMAHAGVRVPKILHAAVEEGFLILEDLGSTHLYDVITEDCARGLELFGLAIDEMVKLHEFATRRVEGDDCTAFYQRMSERLYIWEFDHFLEYGVEARLGTRWPQKEREEVRKLFAKISKELGALPTVFTHRDYHSQNILVKKGEIVLIDFQDALLGPAVYDLASLLRDRYFGLTAGEIDGFLRRYLEGRSRGSGAAVAFSDFRRHFDLQVLQRNMKAAGRFVYLDKVKGKPHQLVHLPNLFESMKEVIARRPELAPLLAMVERAAGGS